MAIFKTIGDTITKTCSGAVLACKEHSPEILLVMGGIGVITGTVLACKATLEAKKIVDETKPEIKDIPEKIEDLEPNEDGTEVTAEQLENEIIATKKANRKLYLAMAGHIAKKALPAVIVMSLSLASIIQSNHIMKQRNIGLAAAYTAIDKSFKAYRKRVVDKFGEDVDKELMYGVRKETIEKKETDENGNEVTKKEVITLSDYAEYGPYAVNYTEESDYYENSSYANELTLTQKMKYLSDLLVIKKYVTLNEALDIVLGPTRGNKRLRKAGMVVGWIYDPKNNKTGDNDIVFNIFKVNRKNKFGEMEEQIIVDFNVDGTIYNRIDTSDDTKCIQDKF